MNKPTIRSKKQQAKLPQTNGGKTDEVASMIQKGGRKFLSALKKKSIRTNNSWYRVLTLDKRRLIDAVIQTVDKVQSSLLLKILTPLAGKLLQAIGGVPGLLGQLTVGMKSYGQPLAQRISQIAQNWGNKSAVSWAKDAGFIRFLTVIDINDLSMFRASTKL